MPEPTDIGTRLCDIRKRRGLTQGQLSDASGVSLSLIRKLEQQQVDRTRLETARKLAAALRIPTSCLLDRGNADAGQHAEVPSTLWLPVRQAVELPPPKLADQPTTAGVQAAVDAVKRKLNSDHLAEVATLLPHALHDAEGLGDAPGGRVVQAYALQLAGSVLTQTHQYDAAGTALRRALAAAEDQQRSASIVGTMCWLAMRQGRLTEARELATKWADEVEPHRLSRASTEDLAAWGGLLLHLSAVCIRDNRPEESADALQLARGLAVITGRELSLGARLSTWGPLAVAYKRAEQHMILDRPDMVLRIGKDVAARTSPQGQAQTEYNRHRLDVAAAHSRMRDHGQAVEVLEDVHARVPEWLSQQRYARDILDEVVKRRRTLTSEMRRLVDAVGLSM
ncbi:helix-turn-helix domain-containing protein [Streptomyces zagrosensis]|uniref:Transcriptional regulator with XRE-family HTH domain n=1 Tax=Streptomyces zagrosensis TaxID=1042984 RepID=A0A7W9UXJ2_9ACTN|nr:helix-turn-helix domain-containing protein [Streptomyces zagrosensis]MBB5934968.1 transcriptional regulator with XRE-family HTH domain [Streptomyces zagrosensis]